MESSPSWPAMRPPLMPCAPTSSRSSPGPPSCRPVPSMRSLPGPPSARSPPCTMSSPPSASIRVGPFRFADPVGPLRSAHVDHVRAVGRDRPARPRHHVIGPDIHVVREAPGFGAAQLTSSRAGASAGSASNSANHRTSAAWMIRGARTAGEDVAARPTVQRRDVGAPAERVVALVAVERDARARALADVAGRRRLIVAVFEAHVGEELRLTGHAVRRVGRASVPGPDRRAGVGKDDAAVLARDRQAVRLAGIGGVDQWARALPPKL